MSKLLIIMAFCIVAALIACSDDQQVLPTATVEYGASSKPLEEHTIQKWRSEIDAISNWYDNNLSDISDCIATGQISDDEYRTAYHTAEYYREAIGRVDVGYRLDTYAVQQITQSIVHNRNTINFVFSERPATT